MRRVIRLLTLGSFLAFFLFGLAVGTASALSLLDLVKLKTAGISDDVLVAVIEADRTVFQLTPDDIVMLRKQGFSDKVIIALLQTITKGQPAPQVVPYEMPAAIGPPPQPAPVVVNVTQTVEQHVDHPAQPHVVYQSVPYPVFVNANPRPRAPDPIVYWGFGGERRSDSWSTQAIEDHNRNQQKLASSSTTTPATAATTKKNDKK